MAVGSFFHSLWTTLLCILHTFSLLLCRRRRTPASTFSAPESKTYPDNSLASRTDGRCHPQQTRTASLSRVSCTLSQARISLLSLQRINPEASIDDSQLHAELGQSKLINTCRDPLSIHTTVGLGFLSPEALGSPQVVHDRLGSSIYPAPLSNAKHAAEHSIQCAERGVSVTILPGPTCHGVKIKDSPLEKSLATELEGGEYLISSLLLARHSRSFSLVSASYSELDSSPHLCAALASCNSSVEFFSSLRVFEPLTLLSIAPVSLVAPPRAASRSRSKSFPANSQSVMSTPAQCPGTTKHSAVHPKGKRHTISLAEALPLLNDAIRRPKDRVEEEMEEEVVISPFQRSWASDGSETSLCALADK